MARPCLNISKNELKVNYPSTYIGKEISRCSKYPRKCRLFLKEGGRGRGEERKKGGSVNPQTSSRMLAMPTECTRARKRLALYEMPKASRSLKAL